MLMNFTGYIMKKTCMCHGRSVWNKRLNVASMVLDLFVYNYNYCITITVRNVNFVKTCNVTLTCNLNVICIHVLQEINIMQNFAIGAIQYLELDSICVICVCRHLINKYHLKPYYIVNKY